MNKFNNNRSLDWSYENHIWEKNIKNDDEFFKSLLVPFIVTPFLLFSFTNIVLNLQEGLSEIVWNGNLENEYNNYIYIIASYIQEKGLIVYLAIPILIGLVYVLYINNSEVKYSIDNNIDKISSIIKFGTFTLQWSFIASLIFYFLFSTIFFI